MSEDKIFDIEVECDGTIIKGGQIHLTSCMMMVFRHLSM